MFAGQYNMNTNNNGVGSFNMDMNLLYNMCMSGQTCQANIGGGNFDVINNQQYSNGNIGAYSAPTINEDISVYFQIIGDNNEDHKISIQCIRSNKITDVIAKLMSKIGEAFNNHVFSYVYNGQNLMLFPDKTLGELNITNHSIVKVTVNKKSIGSTNKIIVFIYGVHPDMCNDTEFIEVSPSDSIDVLTEKYGELYLNDSNLISSSQGPYFNSGLTTFASCGIKNYDIFYKKVCAPSINTDKIKLTNDLNIGFDVNLLSRDELHVNLIHFDTNMTNKENYFYCCGFNVNVVGRFFAFHDLSIFNEYLTKISGKNIPFIVVCSGSSGKNVIPICKKHKFIKEVIIFCANFAHNKHYLTEHPGYVKKVITEIDELYNYLRKIGTFNSGNDLYGKTLIDKYNEENLNLFDSLEIRIGGRLDQCPIVSAYEYDNCYFLIHRAYSYFFKDINNIQERATFQPENFSKILSCLVKIGGLQNNILNIFKLFLDTKDNNSFVENCINAYTKDGPFYYLFNKLISNFDCFPINFAYFMGPFLFGVNKYVKENPSFAFTKDMILFRNIKCSNLYLYYYKLNKGHIMCFPSLTSTSSKENKFPQQQNNNQDDNKDLVSVKLIFKYKHKPCNISPGIIVENKKGKNGVYLSSSPEKNEVILFPFTFARVINVKEGQENGEKINLVELEIINRNKYLEYALKNDVNNRFSLSNLD